MTEAVTFNNQVKCRESFWQYFFLIHFTFDCILGKEAVDSWYSEIKDYNWNSPGFNYKTGRTQDPFRGCSKTSIMCNVMKN